MSEPLRRTHSVPLRWRDTDALGHVNHAVMSSYLEVGRDAMLLAVLDPNLYVIVRMEMNFRAELLLSAGEVTVETAVASLGTSSMVLDEAVRDPHGTVIVESRTTVVQWDPTARSSRAFTAGQRSVLLGD